MRRKENQIHKNFKQLENLKSENIENFLNRLERKWDNTTRQFARLAEDIHYWVLKKEDIALFAQQKILLGKNSLQYSKTDIPTLISKHLLRIVNILLLKIKSPILS